MINKKRVIIAIAVLVVIVAGALTSTALRNYLMETEVSKLKFQTGMEYETIAYGKEILLVNHEGIVAINRSGRELWKIVCAATSPTVSVKGKYIMIADMNGRDISIYKEDRLVSRIKTEKDILSAKMNKNGYVAVATTELGYKGMITVFDKGGAEVFRWHSGSGYIGSMDISSKNKIVTSQIMTDKESVYSKILCLNIKKEDEISTFAELDGIAMEIRFKDNGGFVVVTDEGVHGFKKSGKASYSTDFGGRVLKSYNVNNEHNLVFTFDNGRNGEIVESYSAKGEFRGSFDAEIAIKSFDVSGECIVIGTDNNLLRITPVGKLKSSTEISHDIKKVKLFESRDRVIVIGGDSAEIIKI